MTYARVSRKVGFAAAITLVLVWWAIRSSYSEAQNLSTGKGAQPAPVKTVGRYQVSVGGHAPYIVLIDTATGECWGRDAAGEAGWTDLDSPTEAKAPKSDRPQP